MHKHNTLSVVRAVLFGALGFLVLFCAIKSVAALCDPYPDDYVNGIIINYAKLLLEKGSYFLPINAFPLVHGAYPPVFIGLVSLCGSFLGFHFYIIRGLSLLFSLLIALVIFLFIRKETNNSPLAACLSLLFFAPAFMSDWITAGRVDMLAILFSITGLYLYRRNGTRLFWPGTLFVLAFFTKHVAVFAPLAVIIDLALLKKDIRKAALFTLWYGAVIAVIFGGLMLWTHGQIFLHLFTYTKVAGIEWQVALTKYIRYVRPLVILLAVGLYGLLTKRPNVLGIYAVLNFLFLVMAGKDGAATNYFIEPFVSLLLYAGMICNDLLRSLKKEALLVWILLLFQTVSFFENPRYYLDVVQHTLAPARTQQEQLYREVLRTKGPILSEDLGYITMAGRPVTYGEPFQFMKLAQAEQWDPTMLTNACNAHYFSLIIAGERIKAIPAMQQSLDRHYAKTGTLLGMDIYR